MTSFLYIWNPEKWQWSDLQNVIFQVNNDELLDLYWSCGNTKKIVPGDTFFLMRLGVDPKGIIGFGFVLSTPYLLPHWDKKKAKDGKTALRTDILFRALAEEPFFSLAHLSSRYPNFLWTPQSSGMTVPSEISAELIKLIQSQTHVNYSPPTPVDINKHTEGKPKIVTVKQYDRSSVARRACIGHHGYQCAVCGFNFGKVYGDLGFEYIEVHHVRPISEVKGEHEIDPLVDLRPVCANCHRMLHKKNPPLSIEELKKIKDDVYKMVRRTPVS